MGGIPATPGTIRVARKGENGFSANGSPIVMMGSEGNEFVATVQAKKRRPTRTTKGGRGGGTKAPAAEESGMSGIENIENAVNDVMRCEVKEMGQEEKVAAEEKILAMKNSLDALLSQLK